MTGSVAVDVALGMVFTFLVFSTVCSGLSEAISQFLNRRGSQLFDTINGLLGDKTAQERFWGHPLITGLIRSRNLKATAEQFLPDALETKVKTRFRTKTFEDIAPSYISPSTFAKVLLDITGVAGAAGGPLAGVAGAAPAAVQVPGIDSIVRTAEGDVARAQAQLESWFNDTMDRLSGYYKRWTKVVLLVLSVIVVIAFNVNTIQLAQSLWREPAVRSGVVQAAQSPAASAGQTASQQVSTAVNQALNLPIGWSSSTWHVDHGRWFWTVIGWLLSIGAVSLGAPFWFDLLGKLNSLRSTGPPPAT